MVRRGDGHGRGGGELRPNAGLRLGGGERPIGEGVGLLPAAVKWFEDVAPISVSSAVCEVLVGLAVPHTGQIRREAVAVGISCRLIALPSRWKHFTPI